MIPKPATDLIDLQHAHVTQFTSDGHKSDWSVQQNITNDELFVLPGHLTEKDVFAILRFARTYELEALNAGIQFQKKHQDARLLAANQELQAKLEAVTRHADTLADRVEQFTRGEDS